MAGAECRGPQIKFLLENWSFVQVMGEGQQSVASCKHVAYANSYSQSAGQGKLTSNKGPVKHFGRGGMRRHTYIRDKWRGVPDVSVDEDYDKGQLNSQFINVTRSL